ncbi:MAG: Slp family lipoprotein [Pseudomonadota bacterium]|nr:Slp family lipoprotein [Pseudomonadota bacterium]
MPLRPNRDQSSRLVARLGLAILAPLLLSACASRSPLIVSAPEQPLALGTIDGAVEQHLGRSVRWGGRALAVTAQQGHHWIEIEGRPLGSAGMPRSESSSTGRFIAQVPDALIPTRPLRSGTLVTVFGTITDQATQQLGALELRLPVVAVEAIEVWRDPQPPPPVWPPAYWHPWPYPPDPYWLY